MKKIDRFRKHIEGRLTSDTVNSYCYHVSHFLNTYPNADKFSYADLDKVKAIEVNRGSYRVFIASIKSYYQYLFEKRYRKDNPASLIELGRRKEHKIQHQDLINRKDLESLLDAREERYEGTKERNQLIISLLIYQGLKSQEIVNLKVDDIDLNECVVKVSKTPTTNARVIELKPKQIGYLNKWLSSREKLNRWNYNALLLGVRHKPFTVDAINRMLRQLDMVLVSMNVNALTIRQSVIANWLNVDKRPLADVQLLAGHKYPSSTQVYIQDNPEEKRKLINQFHPLC